MDEERPAEPARHLDKIGAMALDPLLIVLAQGLGAAGDHAVPAFARGEFGAPGVGQRFLGGIENLDQMAAHALRGDFLEPLGHVGDRLKKVAEQKALGEASQSRVGREARFAGVAHEHLGDAACSDPSDERLSAHETDALAAAGEKFGKRQRQHHGPAFLGHLGERRTKPHRRRQIDPEPDRMRRLPFALAHVEIIGTGRAAPVDEGDRVVLIVVPELPEGLAGSGAAAAMRAVGDGLGDALRLDQERRHARR